VYGHNFFYSKPLINCINKKKDILRNEDWRTEILNNAYSQDLWNQYRIMIYVRLDLWFSHYNISLKLSFP